jgi:hypothetical protein
MKWSDEEIAYLKKYYPILHTSKIEKHLNRRKTAIRTKACVLGIKKTEECKMKTYKLPNSGQFTKGMTSWNSGLKLGSSFGGVSTQFKKGQVAHNKLTPEIKEVTLLIRKIKRYAKKQN